MRVRTPAAAGNFRLGNIGPLSLLMALGALAAALSMASLLGRASPIALPAEPSTAGQSSYAKLPLSFVPNRGQADPKVRYLAQTGGASFHFTPDRIAISLQKGDKGHALQLRFLGANPSPALVAGERRRGRVNYITAGARHTNIPTFATLTYRDLWPGIDMAVKGQGGALKYEFHLAPGADPSDIRLAYAGASGISLEDGALRIGTTLGPLSDQRPHSYQRMDGRNVPVASRYVLRGKRSYGFELGAHARSIPVVIDPELEYSTLVGGAGQDSGHAVAVDTAGHAYVAGFTTSPDFPATAGAFDPAFGADGDAFVAKLDRTGSRLVYATYLGGHTQTSEFGNLDSAYGVGIDDEGSAYVTGYTQTPDFPTTPGAYDRTLDGSQDVFVAKLNPAGSGLVYSTYLGGDVNADGRTSSEFSGDIAVGADGSAYIAGQIMEFGNFTGMNPDFPITPGAFDTTYNRGGSDAFITRLNSSGSDLVFSTFLGGNDSDEATAIDLDSNGNPYVTGRSFSSTARSFPITPGAADPGSPTCCDGHEAFASKFTASGSELIYSTYLGGRDIDFGEGIAVDREGNAYVAGSTSSIDFPTTPGAFDTTRDREGFPHDAFVTKVNAGGTRFDYSTYLGGESNDNGYGIAVDDEGSAHVIGQTGSQDFPTSIDARDRTFSCCDFFRGDAFFTKLSPTGSGLDYSTYLGGAGPEQGLGIAVSHPDTYLTGFTGSDDFPTTATAFDTQLDGTSDAFLAKFDFGPGPPAALDLTPETATNPLGMEHCMTATARDATGDPTPDITVRFMVSGSVETSGSDTTDANGQASFCYQGPNLPGEDQIVAFADTDADANPDPGEPSAGGATKTWVAPESTPDCSTSDRGRITTESGSRAFFKGRSDTSPTGQPSGSETYNDRGQERIDVRSISIDALICSGRDATIHGRADVNGDEQGFRIELHDGGNHRRDTYRIVLSSGYDSGARTLRSGNIKVR